MVRDFDELGSVVFNGDSFIEFSDSFGRARNVNKYKTVAINFELILRIVGKNFLEKFNLLKIYMNKLKLGKRAHFALEQFPPTFLRVLLAIKRQSNPKPIKRPILPKRSNRACVLVESGPLE